MCILEVLWSVKLAFYHTLLPLDVDKIHYFKYSEFFSLLKYGRKKIESLYQDAECFLNHVAANHENPRLYTKGK